MNGVVRAEAWRGFRELVTELGGDAKAIFAEANIDESLLEDPNRYVPVRQLVRSLHLAAKSLKRTDFGMLTGTIPNGSVMGPLSISAINSPTARIALDVVGRYMHLHNTTLRVVVVPVAERGLEDVTFLSDVPLTSTSHQYFDRQVAALHRGLKVICGADYRPINVRFATPRLNPLDVYVRIFGIEPQFDQTSMGIVTERRLLDRRQPGRNVQLHRITEDFLRSVSTQSPESLTVKLRALIRGMLETGQCSPDACARALGLHERSLQRRLHAEGTTFETIKDEVRREVAAALLLQPNVPLTHIAFALDYANPSAFTRSVRRWFGDTPRSVRKRGSAGAVVLAEAVGHTRAAAENPVSQPRRAVGD